MKNNLVAIALIIAAFCLSACSGCKSLSPGGVYDGDALLYNAEAAVVSSYVVFDTFVKWEYDNRADLEKADANRAAEVKQAADFVRKNAKLAIGSVIAAVELYKKLPTEENRKSLMAALTTLQQEVVKAAGYIKN
ncbi:hypothetical protein OH491_21785 [Termitidicoccus mucosus]|uniref:DUF4398 domain-containing protein n=1 Tax=Termitidicoccus mucosus TaxID=1184151 RepID=A0A178ID90_9BACT|nr:hypothetical protein AW736_21930 [Opitutaceae bacterium TSB47]